MVRRGQITRSTLVSPSTPRYHPYFFTIYLSGLFGYEEDRAPGVKALSYVDGVAWPTEGEHEDGLSATLEEGAKAAQKWADANAGTFDTEKTEAIALSRRRRSPLANARSIRVGGKTVQLNK